MSYTQVETISTIRRRSSSAIILPQPSAALLLDERHCENDAPKRPQHIATTYHQEVPVTALMDSSSNNDDSNLRVEDTTSGATEKVPVAKRTPPQQQSILACYWKMMTTCPTYQASFLRNVYRTTGDWLVGLASSILDGLKVTSSSLPQQNDLVSQEGVSLDVPLTPMDRPLVGIIGGIGPAATLYLHELVHERDRRRILEEFDIENGLLADAHYTPFIIYNNPRIPNNNLAALQRGPPSVDELTRSATFLRNAGVDVVAFACTTAHSWQHQVSQSAGIPVLNLLKLVAQRVESKGHGKIGLLDVDGTHAQGHFQTELQRSDRVTVVLPSTDEQACIMQAVANLKAGVKAEDGPRRDIAKVCHQLVIRDHVTAIVLGCTEIAYAMGPASISTMTTSMDDDDLPLQVEYFDALDILAEEMTRPRERK